MTLMLNTILISAIIGALASYLATPNPTALAFLTFIAGSVFMIWMAQHAARLIHF